MFCAQGYDVPGDCGCVRDNEDESSTWEHENDVEYVKLFVRCQVNGCSWSGEIYQPLGNKSGNEYEYYSSTKSDWSGNEYEYNSSTKSDCWHAYSVSDRLALGLNPSGPLKLEDVKIAYRTCAHKWHPDHHQGSSKVMAEEKFKRCNEAYRSLCDQFAEN